MRVTHVDLAYVSLSANRKYEMLLGPIQVEN